MEKVNTTTSLTQLFVPTKLYFKHLGSESDFEEKLKKNDKTVDTLDFFCCDIPIEFFALIKKYSENLKELRLHGSTINSVLFTPKFFLEFLLELPDIHVNCSCCDWFTTEFVVGLADLCYLNPEIRPILLRIQYLCTPFYYDHVFLEDFLDAYKPCTDSLSSTDSMSESNFFTKNSPTELTQSI